MGILNLTNDSFFDGGRFNSEKKALDQVLKMVKNEVDIVDIGGYSSRPNAPYVSLKDEWERLENILKAITNEFPQLILSMDTFRAEIAKRAIDCGADMINDISSGQLDNKMFSTVASLQVPYIMMHMQGTPQTMQLNPTYDNVTKDISTFFEEKINLAHQAGIKQVIIDPGFGFGKKLNHNYQLLNNLDSLLALNKPLLVGVSRKSMIYKVLETSADEALNGTTYIHSICLSKGASIIRAHDVKEAQQCIKLFNFAKTNC